MYVCECHGHSEWSLLDGVGSRELHALRAADLGYVALAQTEHAVLSGTVHHVDACNKVGILPIVGLEAYYRRRRVANTQVDAMRKNGEDVEPFHEYFHMVIQAKNVRGWRTLKLLSSAAYRDGFYRKPCIDDELLDRYHEGVIISTSCVAGYVPQAILRGDDAAVRQHCESLNRWVGDDWYFELQPHDLDDLRAVNLAIPGLADHYGKPIVATRDVHAPDPTWVETQHVSISIRTHRSMVSENREAEDVEKYDMRIADTAYLADTETTRVDFQRFHPRLDPRVVEQAMDNTGWVVSRCVPWMLDRSPKLPRYGDTYEQEYQDLRRRVYAGLAAKGKADDPAWVAAVEKELDIYRERRVCAFFLITDDMIRWLRSIDGLPPCEWDPHPTPAKKPQKVGLGRGSAGACRVAYATGITLVNPEAYEMWFERFLNPGRAGLPDIDIDLTEEGERLAKEWLKRTRGRDKVYDMIAHGTLAARGALRRVSMVYDVPGAEINSVAKQIPEDESDLDLEVLRDHVPELARYAERHPKAFEHAARLQGSRVTQSEHASAVVISDVPLEQLMPVMKKSAKDDYMVTAFGDAADKPVTSDLGFLKYDLLRLVQLAKQGYAEELVRRVHGVDLDLDELPTLESPYAVDPRAMNVFWTGAKLGIFQWDGRSNMASVTKRIRPESIYHLAAANAGVRPGVSQQLEEYVRRRHGGEFEYWDPSVEPALSETFGLPLYQEQVMAVFELIGGYSRAEADDVRKIMGKYYRMKGDAAFQMLDLHRVRFVENAALVCRGGRDLAERIWHYCGNACEYLFNRIHAIEYSLIAYGDAYLKAYYPDAFYAALLTFPPAWVKKPENRGPFYERAVREARALGIRINPPDVNESDEGFTVHGDYVRFGLKGIKGLGPAMVADVLNNRPFSSLEDMGARLVACNAAGRHALAQAGALDRFGARENLTPDERASHEEERIGVALSGEDKLAPLREDLRAMIHTQDEVEAAANGEALVVGGEVVDGREVRTRRGPSLKLTVAFGADEYLVSVPPWDYDDEVRALIDADVPVVVRGHRDVAWDCVAADEIKSAREVLDMMTVTS
jgi:DNA polymerase III subunit alpha